MDNVYSDDPIHAAANHLALKIKDRLASGQRVVWLLSGGSGIQAVLATCTLLAGSDLRNLYVTLSDERYGPVGHPDENWQQLLDGGMQLPSANLYRPLTGDDIVTTLLNAEVEGHPEERLVKLALEELRFFSDELRIMGVYPAPPCRQKAKARR